MFTLFQSLLGLVWGIAFGVLGGGFESHDLNPVGVGLMVVGVVAALAMLVPNIAVTVRRFHDQDKSGWFYLLSFIPYVGGLIMIIFMCQAGTRGPNRFGSDPLGRPDQNLDRVFS